MHHPLSTHFPRLNRTGTNVHCLSSFCELRSACTVCTRSACMRCRSSARACFSCTERERSACAKANSCCTPAMAAAHVCSRRSLAGWSTLNAAIAGGTAYLWCWCWRCCCCCCCCCSCCCCWDEDDGGVLDADEGGRVDCGRADTGESA